MAMPEMPKHDSYAHWDSKLNGYRADLYTHEATQEYGKACYAAGKADALPSWPPPEGNRYRHSDSMLFIEFVDGAWQFAPFATDENGNSESYPFHPIAQCKLTIAYLHGELEQIP